MALFLSPNPITKHIFSSPQLFVSLGLVSRRRAPFPVDHVFSSHTTIIPHAPSDFSQQSPKSISTKIPPSASPGVLLHAPFLFRTPSGLRHNQSRSGATLACNLCEIPLLIFIPRGTALYGGVEHFYENAPTAAAFLRLPVRCTPDADCSYRIVGFSSSVVPPLVGHGALLRKYPTGGGLPSRRHAHRIVVRNLGGSGPQP